MTSNILCSSCNLAKTSLVDLFMDGTQVVPPEASGGSIAIEHLPHPPKVEGSSPAPAASIRRE